MLFRSTRIVMHGLSLDFVNIAVVRLTDSNRSERRISTVSLMSMA